MLEMALTFHPPPPFFFFLSPSCQVRGRPGHLLLRRQDLPRRREDALGEGTLPPVPLPGRQVKGGWGGGGCQTGKERTGKFLRFSSHFCDFLQFFCDFFSSPGGTRAPPATCASAATATWRRPTAWSADAYRYTWTGSAAQPSKGRRGKRTMRNRCAQMRNKYALITQQPWK